MRYGSQGRYWNLGLSDPSRLPATSQQLWNLYLLSGRKENYRGQGLTRGEASDLIRAKTAERDEQNKALQGSSMQDAMFASTFKKAVRAANAAGDAWCAENQEVVFSIYDPEEKTNLGLYGAIGQAYIAWPPKRSPFAIWLENYFFNGQQIMINIPHDYSERMERDLQIACARAALRVLDQGGIGGLKLMVRDDPSSRTASEAPH